MSTLTRRDLLGGAATAGIMAAGLTRAVAQSRSGRAVTLEARPGPITLDTAKTAVLVIDMQNDFGTKGGMFDRAGIDISGIQSAVAPIARVLTAARRAEMKIVYLKMGYRSDLSDLGAPDSVNRVRHLQLGVGQNVTAPDGSASRTLIRDTWSSDIVAGLEPEADDIVLYKTRFSGFYKTGLDEKLTELGVKHLIVTGCTTSICVESTVRDAMFRDYSCALLADCMSEPIGEDLARSNHEATLLAVETLLGWVSESAHFASAVAP